MYYWNHIYHLNIQRVWWSVTKHQWSHLGFSLQRKQQQWNRWPEVPSDFFGGFLADMRHGIVVYRPSLGRFQGSLHVVNDHMVKLMGQKKLWGGCYTEGRAGRNKSTQKSRKQVCGVSSWFLSRLGKIPLPIHPDNPHLTTTTRHVMVGITRSKVILSVFYYVFLRGFLLLVEEKFTPAPPGMYKTLQIMW